MKIVSFDVYCPFFVNSSGLKVFIPQNNVEGFFKRSLFFERFCCSIQSKLKSFFLKINLARVSSLPISEIYENGRADNIFEGALHLFLLH